MKLLNHISFTLLSLTSFSVAQTYDVGDTVSFEDQNMAFEVCYGDYPQDSLRLSDLNGNSNGGDYHITIIAMQVAL